MTIRVLEIFREPLANGGQESFIMNMYRNIDRNRVQMDFLTPFTCDNEGLKQEIESLGGHVYHYDNRFGENNNKVFHTCVNDFLSKHHYNTVHFHSGSTYALMEGSKIAAKKQVKNIIVHSHCGGFDNLKYRIIKTISIPYLLRYPTEYFACSHLAAAWKFPPQIIRRGQYKVIKNAIDTDRFRYDVGVRQNYRKKLNVESDLVVGHIGRFAVQKNHRFLISVFSEIVKLHSCAKLVLVGDGELRGEIEQQIRSLGLEDKVMLLGLRKDIPAILNAMDIFVLPSFFEGLPVVGVEAQATGLPVVLSDQIAHELPVDVLSHYIDLEKGPEFWARMILENGLNADRRNMTDEMIRQGYEIKAAAKQLESYYINMNQ